MGGFIDPAVVAALVSGIISIVGVAMNRSTTIRVHKERVKADSDLAKRKFEFDKDLAERKFAQEKAQVVHKRRFELAEAILADAYRLRDLMRYVRNGATFENEGETRKGGDSETKDLKKLKDMYFVPIERLQKQSEFVSSFMTKEHSAQAHFGSDAARAFELLAQSINDVQTAAYTLIEMVGQPNNSADFVRQMRCDIWAGYSLIGKQDDKVGKKIEEAASLIETFCRPALEWGG